MEANFRVKVYIPEEVLNIPDTKLILKSLKLIPVEEMQEKCLSLLNPVLL
jgi:hypothetical protein